MIRRISKRPFFCKARSLSSPVVTCRRFFSFSQSLTKKFDSSFSRSLRFRLQSHRFESAQYIDSC